MLKVNNKDARASIIVLVSLLNLNIFHTFFLLILLLIWKDKCMEGKDLDQNKIYFRIFIYVYVKRF